MRSLRSVYFSLFSVAFEPSWNSARSQVLGDGRERERRGKEARGEAVK